MQYLRKDQLLAILVTGLGLLETYDRRTYGKHVGLLPQHALGIAYQLELGSGKKRVYTDLAAKVAVYGWTDYMVTTHRPWPYKEVDTGWGHVQAATDFYLGTRLTPESTIQRLQGVEAALRDALKHEQD